MKRPKLGWKFVGRAILAVVVLLIAVGIVYGIQAFAAATMRRDYCVNHPTLDGWIVDNATVRITKSLDSAGYDTHPNVYGRIVVRFVAENSTTIKYTADWGWTTDWSGAYGFRLWNQAGPVNWWIATPGPASVPYTVKQVQVSIVSGDYNETLTFPGGAYRAGAPYPVLPTQIFAGSTDHFWISLGISGVHNC